MARGFGPTFGTGTTDIITTALTTRPTLRSYHIWANRNDAGGGNLGRFWDSSGAQDAAYYAATAAPDPVWVFVRGWTVTTAQWWINGTTTPMTTGTWFSFGVSYDGGNTANDPLMYVNGVAKTTTEFGGPPAGTFDTTTGAYAIGNRPADGIRNFDGKLAEYAVWDAILTAGEFAALGKCYSPLLIRPDALVEYVPMVRANVSRILAAPTITGAIVQNHPRIIMPRSSKMRRYSALADTRKVGITGLPYAEY